MTEELRVMSNKKSEEQNGRIETEKREGVSIFFPFYQEMGTSYMQYMLLPKPQKHKGITKSYVFPSKNQWTVCVYLKYWWLKLLRRKPAVCDGVDDQKEIQNVMDNTNESGRVIVLERGEYNMKEILSLRNSNVWITG